MSAALTFDNFAFSYQAAAEAELLTERFAAQPNQDGRPLIGPLCTKIEEGSFTLITGATGCGKTTLLRCCAAASQSLPPTEHALGPSNSSDKSLPP